MAVQFQRKRHGGCKTALYGVWSAMKHRCFNMNHDRFNDWGGRGITVCSEWRYDYAAFRDWAMANGYKKGLQIDRKDNDGNYEPGNCRWVPCKTNVQNTRRARKYTVFGETKCVSEWSRDPRCAVGLITLNGRLRRGWDFQAALTTPGTLQHDEKGRFVRPERVESTEFVPYRKQ